MRAQGGRREQRALASACIANAYQTEAVVPSLISVEMRPQHGRPTYQGKVAAVAPSNHARGLRFTSCNTAGTATYIPSLARSHPTEWRHHSSHRLHEPWKFPIVQSNHQIPRAGRLAAAEKRKRRREARQLPSSVFFLFHRDTPVQNKPPLFTGYTLTNENLVQNEEPKKNRSVKR